MKHLTILLFFAFALSAQAQAQDSTKEKLKALVDGKQYVFEPTTTTSGRGRSIHLGASSYFLEMSGDTLKVYLPYFGKAYSAPIGGSSDGGYDFTSTDFSYEVSEGKKGSYRISIKTKDRSYNADFQLTVYDNGTSYLNASSSDRQTVSYNGNVRAKQ